MKQACSCDEWIVLLFTDLFLLLLLANEIVSVTWWSSKIPQLLVWSPPPHHLIFWHLIFCSCRYLSLNLIFAAVAFLKRQPRQSWLPPVISSSASLNPSTRPVYPTCLLLQLKHPTTSWITSHNTPWETCTYMFISFLIHGTCITACKLSITSTPVIRLVTCYWLRCQVCTWKPKGVEHSSEHFPLMCSGFWVLTLLLVY